MNAWEVCSAEPCGLAADVLVALGCVHEHVGTAPLCPVHQYDVLAGDACCGQCQDGPSPHDCSVRVLEWDVQTVAS